MTLDDFLDFLSANGIPYKTTHQSIVLSGCPSCNSDKDKVWLFKSRKGDAGSFAGQCMKCEHKINSFSFLIEQGFDREVVTKLHGFGRTELDLRILPALDIFGANEPVEQKVEQEVRPVEISAFVKLTDIPNHPASWYALKRGWTKAQMDDILIDYFTSAVVFVVRDGDKVVGFQKRFIQPFDPKFKTMSSQGFLKRKYVIEYPNNGDVCVCEGPFTALSAWHFGFHAICTFGSNVGEEQIDKIWQVAESTGKQVAIAFDLDAAGKKGYLRIRNAMFYRDIATYRIRPESGNDLNDSWEKGKKYIVIPADQTDSVLDRLSLPFASFL
jgi:hypothetical protein